MENKRGRHKKEPGEGKDASLTFRLSKDDLYMFNLMCEVNGVAKSAILRNFIKIYIYNNKEKLQ